MRLHRTRRSPFWQYDFAIDGDRFRGSTRATDKRAAEGAAQRIRAETLIQRAEATKNQPRLEPGAPRHSLTISQATARYWTEHAEPLPSARVIWGKLTLFNDLIGGARLLSDLTDADITDYIARRRALVSDATVNRDITMLRAVLGFAQERCGAAVARLTWRRHRMIEPAGRTRSLTAAEEQALFEQLPDDFKDLVTFCAATGMRETAAISLTWSQVDFAARQIHIRLKSKRPGGAPHVVPITKRLLELLRRQQGRHETRVWCYQSRRSRAGIKIGDWIPFSVSGGWARRWRQALAEAGIENLRFHDLRHTAATRTHRATGSLLAAQKLLGHLSPQSTMRYAHVDTAGLLEAMEKTDAMTTREHGAQLAHSRRKTG